MKERRLFEGELGDGDIEECLNELICLSGKTGEDVFLRWNGMTLRISAESTVDGLLQEYSRQCHARSVMSSLDNGDMIEVNQLARKLAKGIKKFMED